MNLNVPLDFERLPEFWQLGEALRARVKPATPPLTDGQINDQAVVLFMRLWVELGYLARHTNRPGFLNATGERQVNGKLTQFGDDCPPVMVMTGNLLRQGDDGLYCDLFTSLNGHLAGDFVSGEKRGNIASRLSAAKGNIVAAAVQQGDLLQMAIFKKRDATPMTQPERQRCMMLIITLDRCLNPSGFKAVHRPDGTYTAGLMADACAVVEAVTADELQKFYAWLIERRDLPMTPKTTEDLLKDWGVHFKVFKAA